MVQAVEVARAMATRLEEETPSKRQGLMEKLLRRPRLRSESWSEAEAAALKQELRGGQL